MEEIGEMIATVLANIGNDSLYSGVREKVSRVCKEFPLYSDLVKE